MQEKTDARRVIDGEIIPEGERNDTLFKYAARCRNYGLGEAEILDRLIARNEQCDPPLDEDELVGIAHSAMRYEPVAELVGLDPDKPGEGAKLANPIEESGIADDALQFNADPGYMPIGDPRRFFSKRKFVANRMALEIMTWHTLYHVAGQWWEYWGGVYHPRDEVMIAREIDQRLQNLTKPAYINEALDLLRVKCARHAGAFNQRGHLINVSNGLVQWREGCDPYDWPELDEVTRHGRDVLSMAVFYPKHTPNHLSTIQLPVEYDPEATCPAIDRFLHQVLPADAVEAVYEWIGYLMTQETSMDAMMVLVGEGANGKSVLLEVIRKFLGEENCASETLQDLAESRFRVANLYGKLVNIFSDLDERRLDSTGRIKNIISGEPIEAERKMENSFTFRPFARLMFSTNRMPRTSDRSHGFRRRLWIVPFTKRFGEGGEPAIERGELVRQLTAPEELSGLLNRAIEGLMRLYRRGHFLLPRSSREAMGEYERENSTVLQFVAESCEPCDGPGLPRAVWYEAYRDWCSENGFDRARVPATEAYRQLEAQGYTLGKARIAGENTRVIRGLCLVPDVARRYSP